MHVLMDDFGQILDPETMKMIETRDQKDVYRTMDVGWLLSEIKRLVALIEKQQDDIKWLEDKINLIGEH